MTFIVGQKVICLRDSWDVLPPGMSRLPSVLPKAGCEYVVRSCEASHWPECRYAIRLRGLHLSKLPNGLEPSFCTHGFDGLENFKPVIERPNDGEAFVRKLKELCGPRRLEKANATSESL